ncbi:DUF4959 domain-containing protein [Pedobacter hiemivivus]|uniref:DUF4959 domain-containing protein n=1 Tax=Pedobacter hiemivivus TaxID=2530454 RepID=A0A4U1GLH8_9SPHI|nr:DUF5000 domain-containing lipoprotein [Pedobacter hiemivivus]TCC99290.1 DUF4959 domain-containing protein [Pedobacter hiemivivus]TKC63863.1 DUF4959 domain-containing protein [Pedobacter hiemivivus]
MKKVKIFIYALISLSIFSCKEDLRAPLYDGQNPPPPISSASVEAIPGGVKITYRLPDDPGLLYVKATYDLKGVKMEAKSSYYNNFIIVEGFGDTKEKEVSLYAVSRSEKLSTPVTLKVTPLPAPVYDVYNSLQVNESFGGFTIAFENPAALGGGVNSNITMGVVRWDDILKEWVRFDSFYSGLAKGIFSVRRQPPVLTQFGVFLKDRWGNYTDTLKKTLTPWPEVELDRTKFKDARKNPVPQRAPFPELTGIVKDAEHEGSYPWDKMFDGDITTFFHTKQRYDMPIWMPVDLGVTAKLSRYVLWQRTGSGWPFTHGNPHEWEIWGTNNVADPNSWIKLDHQVMVKPSGSPIGVLTNDDKAVAELGMEYNIDPALPAVRYVAFKLIDNWASIGGATGFMHVAELKFYGQLK